MLRRGRNLMRRRGGGWRRGRLSCCLVFLGVGGRGRKGSRMLRGGKSLGGWRSFGVERKSLLSLMRSFVGGVS